MAEAFENATIAMFGYMTDLSTVEVDASKTFTVTADGHDLLSLLYNFMDEFLFVFSSEYTIVKRISISKFDSEKFSIEATG
jgi:SHS2 domain-containing protein